MPGIREQPITRSAPAPEILLIVGSNAQRVEAAAFRPVPREGDPLGIEAFNDARIGIGGARAARTIEIDHGIVKEARRPCARSMKRTVTTVEPP